MLTLLLSQPQIAMLKAAADRPDGTVRAAGKRNTARALRERGLVRELKTGRRSTVYQITHSGRGALIAVAE